MFNTSDFCWYWLFTKSHWTKTTSRLGTFSPFFDLLIYFVLPNNFLVSGFRNSSLYPSFIIKTNLLLILLMQTWNRGFAVMLRVFYDIFNIIMNIWHWIRTIWEPIQTHHSMLELLFWVYLFYMVVLYFSTCNISINFEEQHVCWNFLNLISATS